MRYLLLLLVVLTSCTPQGDSYRVAVLSYQHETCTFCPGGDTEAEDWLQLSPILMGDSLFESGTYMRGFVKQAREYPDMELIGLRSPLGVFGGSSRSWNSEESFDFFMGGMLEDLEAAMPVDGVYLALHGAMAVRNIPRPEAEIAKRVWEVVGEGVPIIGTFDLHGNEDGEFLEWADGAFVTKRFPHYDDFIQGERAARYMRNIMAGTYTPTTASRKPPVVTATVLQWTGQSPAMDIMERARRWEAREDDAYVSVFFGYPWSDVPDIGATVHVMTNNDQALADHIADDMEAYIWRVRRAFAYGQFPMPPEAMQEAVAAVAAGNGPVALGDYSDRPGDATWLLQEVLHQGVQGALIATIRDEGVIESLVSSGAEAGDPFDMEVGGFTGEQAGEPVRVLGTLKFLEPMGPYEAVAAVDFNGNTLIITPALTQIMYPESLRLGGLEPDDYDIFIVKSRVHFRRGFDETGYANTILVVDAPGPWVGTTRLDALDYEFGPIESLYPFRPGD